MWFSLLNDFKLAYQISTSVSFWPKKRNSKLCRRLCAKQLHRQSCLLGGSYLFMKYDVFRQNAIFFNEWSLCVQNLLDPYQSGYRKHHLTETVVLNITNDILSKKDSHQATALVSIDLSAAFDLVDHDVLVKRLDNYFGFSATVLDWFKSFLSDRSQCVILGSARPKRTPVLQGVPQGSVLGARLYTLYVRPMSEICKRHDIHVHYH